ncbi:MAG: hypothetical protein MHM6MM_000012 [Cercozoa sp. M6MM]
MSDTPVESIEGIVGNVRHCFNSGKTQSVEWRKQQLRALQRMLVEKREALEQASRDDLHKHASEFIATEWMVTYNEVSHTLAELDDWVKPQSAKRNIVVLTDRTVQVHSQPLGVVLIIGPFNYATQLILLPLIGAIAAGNCCVIKPSELASAQASLLQELLPQYLDPEAVQVVTGGIPQSQEVLKQRFDKIFFTGGARVGRIVMEAAAKHLTPVVLELGGKSPVFVADDLSDTELRRAAETIAWARYSNCGQTCIAPEYVMCSSSMSGRLVGAIRAAVREFYGDSPSESTDYGRMISEGYARRVRGLIEELPESIEVVVLEDESSDNAKHIPPTVVVQPPHESTLMREEVFGPVLAVLHVDGVEEAADYVNRGEKPLIAYCFASSNKTVDRFCQRTYSGMFVGNGCLVNASVPSLPFGGVGMSGIGGYHGKLSFDTFSHQKAVLMRRLDMATDVINRSLLFPPYSLHKTRRLLKIALVSPPMSAAKRRALFALAFLGVVGVTAFATHYFMKR